MKITGQCTMTEMEVFKKVRATWSDQGQIDVAMEELSELIQALVRYRRRRIDTVQVCEEIADVSIMVDQLIEIFGRENCDRLRRMKMRRLWDRVSGVQV